MASGARFCGHCGLSVPVDTGQSLPVRSPEGAPHVGPSAAPGSGTLSDFLLGVDILKRYPVIVAPPLIAMCVVFVAVILLFGGAVGVFGVGGFARRGPGIGGAAFGSLVLALMFLAIAMAANLISSAVVVVMAADALTARPPSLASAYGRVTARLGDVMGACILSALIIGVASVFLIIPGLIAAFFLMFTLPALLLDGARPMESLRRSARLVRDNVGRTLGLVAGAIVASVVLWVISIVLHGVPVAGQLVSMLLGGLLVSYLTTVAVRVFQTLPRS